MSKWKDFDKFYNNLLSEVYHEPDSMLTTQVTDRMLPGFLELFTTNEKILDLGCGAGYAMKKMREFGMKDVEGLTLSDEDIKSVAQEGFNDGIWMRHTLEHSPFPLYTIYQLNKMLKMGGRIYIEMPQPSIERLKNSERNLEHWPNHYSIMGQPMYKSLFQRAGFKLLGSDEIFLGGLKVGDKTYNETYDWYVFKKQNNIEIKNGN